MKTLRLAAAALILAGAIGAKAHAQNNITLPVRNLCVGATIEPSHLREARIVIAGTEEL